MRRLSCSMHTTQRLVESVLNLHLRSHTSSRGERVVTLPPAPNSLARLSVGPSDDNDVTSAGVFLARLRVDRRIKEQGPSKRTSASRSRAAPPATYATSSLLIKERTPQDYPLAISELVFCLAYNAKRHGRPQAPSFYTSIPYVCLCQPVNPTAPLCQ